MTDQPLTANSLAEAYLYLLATPCASCGRGPLAGSDAHKIGTGAELQISIRTLCGNCKEKSEFHFALPHGLGTQPDDAPADINPTGEPSAILDVASWIVLFRSITETAGRTKDKQEARRLGIEAAQCLEEALKFYDDEGNDLPPSEAFFHDQSRERFRANPENFSRRRLLDLRSKLPSMTFMRRRTREEEEKKRKKPLGGGSGDERR